MTPTITRATALLVYGRLKPTWVQLRPWYEDRELTRKVNTPPPAPAVAREPVVEAAS